MKEVISRCIFLASLLLLATFASAGNIIVYNSFGPGNSYNTSTSWTLDGVNVSPVQAVGMQFTPSISSHLVQIDFAGVWFSGPNLVTLELTADNSNAPGAVLESWTLALPPFGNNPPVSLISLLHPDMAAGVTYDLVALPDANEWAGWNFNSQGFTSTGLFSFDGGNSWSAYGQNTDGAYRVTGNPVPEPSSIALLGTGLVALVGAVRRRIS